ncbi:TPA: hypothetical protein U2L64_004099 [Citrobacter koseri]|uniref:hypothetical protein n=1 Tax=Citrobacter koseri TaxID=545 RepID=UPI0019024065|nr:hypothetical protein [Citrobacter koseri]MBJ9068783.1 hypothetical protein [Citrobacter koseri]HEM7954797.1 hypothetical protein [Citrobacter koseri]HEM7991992.1 hypothetical protein [Citrobacter koseri]
MKTIQLSERELSMIFSMLTPPYHVSDTHTDEFNELRNKVFYALRDAKNDEPVSQSYKLPVGWVAVPVEPTPEMIAAAMDSDDVSFDKKDDTMFYVHHDAIWRAMLTAALQPQNQQQNIPNNIPDTWKKWVSDVIEYLENGLEADGELEAQGSIDAKRLLAAAPQQVI